MTRNYVTAMTALAAVAFVSVVSGTGCQNTGVGDPCIPEAEYAADFLGFDQTEVNVESKSFQCQTRLCLVNHFQGRVSCPYGQNTNANGSATDTTPQSFQCNGQGAPNTQHSPCCVPGVDEPVLSDTDCPPQPDGSAGNCTSNAGAKLSPIKANCTDRTADKAVYCSCRCENSEGKTDDGAVYCQCPSGFTCSQLVQPIGVGNAGLTGGYCIKQKTDYAPGTSCSNTCQAGTSPGQPGYCGSSNSAQL
jgi:hypothetical protein